MNGNAWCHANGPCAHIFHPVGNGGEDVLCDVLPMLAPHARPSWRYDRQPTPIRPVPGAIGRFLPRFLLEHGGSPCLDSFFS